MNRSNDLFYLRAFYGLLLIHFLVWFSLGMILDLHPDTADHWVWSRYLSWGYYEHPPMIAWVIRLFTILLGNRQLALAFASQVITLMSLLPVFLLARKMFGTRAAFWSALSLEATPLILVGSMIFVIDTVLILFFLWAALGFWKGFAEGNKKAYYWAGLALGLAFLSKITAVLFPLACFVFLLVSEKRRSLLANFHLYGALILSLVVFSPFLFWNMQHEWISVKAQLEKGLTGGRDWNQTLGFWFGQPLIIGPVLFYFAVKALWEGRQKFKLEARFAYLLILTIIPILFFGLASFRGKYSDPAWTDIGWPFGAILLGNYFSERLSTVPAKKALIVGGLIFLTSWMPIGMMAWQALSPFIPVPVQNDRTLEMRGWRELGAAMGREYTRYFPENEQVFVVAEEYQVAAAVSFYSPQHPVPYSFGKEKRNFWVIREELQKKGALMVCRPENCENNLQRVQTLFEQTRFVSTAPFYRGGQLAKEFRIYHCFN